MPGSMRTHHSNIHCSFAHTSCLVRACAFKTPAKLHKPCSEPYNSAVVHSSVSINQSLAFVVNKHMWHHLYTTHIRAISLTIHFWNLHLFHHSVSLLKDLSRSNLFKLAESLEVEFYQEGEYIVREGTRGDTFYILSKGSVRYKLMTNEENLARIQNFVNLLHYVQHPLNFITRMTWPFA